MHASRLTYITAFSVAAAGIAISQPFVSNNVTDWTTSGPLLPANLSSALHATALRSYESQCNEYLYGGDLKRANCLQAADTISISSRQKTYRLHTDPGASDYRLPFMVVSSKSKRVNIHLHSLM